MKIFITLGALVALIGVALGAFGAHALKSQLTPEALAVWNTAVFYQLIHALGLLLIGILCQLFPADHLLRTAAWTMLVGIVLFSGSLYLLTVSGIRPLGMITPLGGVAFLTAWLLLIVAVWRPPSQGAGGGR